MNRLQKWLTARRVADEQAVIKAIGMLRPSQASGYPIARLAHCNVSRAYAALDRLEDSGRVVSDWADGPRPRRRLYRVVSAAARNGAA